MNKISRNLALTGFMATGKTVIGKNVAQKLGMNFADIDTIIEERANISIAQIFQDYGEPYFRELEKNIIKEISQNSDYVISTGGGAVLCEENIKNLRTNGFICHLKSRPEIICRNVGNQRNRPLLNCSDPEERIQKLLIERIEFYNNNDFEVDVSDLSVELASEKVTELFITKLSEY